MMIDKINNNPNFTNNISDKAAFCLNEFVKRHNCSYWPNDNPHLDDWTLYPQKLNVWAGIIGQNITGPYFLNENVTANIYLYILDAW